MSDTEHGHDAHPQDPNASPLRQEVKDRFSGLTVALCYGLALAAGIAGLVTGLLVVND